MHVHVYREPSACPWAQNVLDTARVRRRKSGHRRRRSSGHRRARDRRAAPHTHSFSPALVCAPLVYQRIPKHGSRKSMSRCPSLMGYLGVAVLGVAVLGTAVLGVAVLGTAVLQPGPRIQPGSGLRPSL